MEITDVRIRPISDDSQMKAIVSVTFDGEFVVHDMKLINGEKGLFLAMPSRRSPDGVFRDIAHPINSSMREKLQEAVLRRYEAEVVSKMNP